MKFFKEMKSKSLWIYIFSFSAIILFIVLIMGSYLYWFYYHTIYDDFKKSNQDYLSALSIQHENEMQILNDIMTQLSLDGSNVEFILEKQPKKNMNLKEKLNQYVSVSQFFGRLFFFYHGDQYLYNHTTSISVDRFLTKGIKLENCSQDELKNILYREEKGMYVLPEQGVGGESVERSGEVVSRAVTYVLPMEPKRKSTAVFLVGEQYYDRLFDSSADDMRQTYLFYKGDLIVTRGTLSVIPPIPENLSEGQKQYEIEEDGEVFLVTWMTGESELVYCTVQSVKIFKNKILSGQWGILLVLAICSIPTSLVFCFLSKSLSGKVKIINSLLGAEEAYNLEKLELGVRNLIEDRKETNEETLLFYKTRFVSSFIAGKYTDRNMVLDEAAKAKIDAEKPYFIVALMGGSDNIGESRCNEMMLHIINEKRCVDGYGIHLINSNQSLYVLFGDTKKGLEEVSDELFVIGKNCCEEFVMSASDYQDDFEKADRAYLEADAAYGTRLLVDNSRIIYFRNVKLKEQAVMLSDSYLQRLKNSIRMRGKAENKKVIQEICDKLRSSGQSLMTFRVLCNDIIHMLLSEWPEDTNDFENIYNVFTLSQCLTINDFHDILLEVSNRLMESSLQTEESDQDFVNEAINYMKLNYSDINFTMGTLAEHLGISGTVLAVKFKNIMDISPSDYLAMLRMEKAKELLEKTDMQVKEICLAVGYEDARVFIRRFKNYTNNTPGQYRSRVSQNNK